MGGAIGVAFFAFAMARQRTTAFLGGAIHLPGNAPVDRRLLVGSLVFGAGWGLAGFCPGPAVVAAGGGSTQALVFTLAMIAGMALHEFAAQPATRSAPVLE